MLSHYDIGDAAVTVSQWESQRNWVYRNKIDLKT